MLHLPPNYFFPQRIRTKNASEPLQALGSLPITSAPPMLHWCNIFNENFPETGELNASETLILIVNPNFTSVFSRRDGILHLGNPRPAYAGKNLREASVKVSLPSEHL